MEDVIHLGIPHIGEKIFESICYTDQLIQFRKVSKTWEMLIVVERAKPLSTFVEFTPLVIIHTRVQKAGKSLQ